MALFFSSLAFSSVHTIATEERLIDKLYACNV